MSADQLRMELEAGYEDLMAGNVQDAVESMKMFPERCRVFDTRSERDLGMRQIPVDNYTAVYVIQGDDVVALRVLYSASDINARLREDR